MRKKKRASENDNFMTKTARDVGSAMGTITKIAEHLVRESTLLGTA